tara:strand:+ start:574 stop:1011 length:438 start_codon:yes stop_codon:yes gene_type:complete
MFTDAKTAFDFILAGKARVTLTSKVSGNSFTFKIDAPKDRATGETDRSILFVKVLNGPDNSWDGDWMFIGFIRPVWPSRLVGSKKGHPDAPSFRALDWTLTQLAAGNLPDTLEVRHEGQCGRCGRALTVPSSIDSGFGPHCAAQL